MISRESIIERARSFLGTPFHHQGRVKGVGVDCIGLVIGVAEELGMPYRDLIGYPRFPDGKTLCREFEKNMQRIAVESLQPGDVAAFTMGGRDRMPRHAGIVAQKNGARTMIHTWASTRCVVEHTIDEKWVRRLCAGFLYPGVEPGWRL